MMNIEKYLYKDESEETLKEIYKDYLSSKELGISNQSFLPYARKIREAYGNAITISDGLSIAEEVFFKEITSRYFEENSFKGELF